MPVYTETIYLERCRELIAEKLGWTSIREWRNYEFNLLSEQIFNSTGVQLSSTTLKRLFGKIKYDHVPSSATLNTLARFLEYENWMNFKSASLVGPPAFISLPNPGGRRRSLIRKLIIACTLVTVLLVTAFGFIVLAEDKTTPGNKNPGDILFTSRPLAQGLPNSVVFQLSSGNIQSDDIMIQQSWDSTKTLKLTKGQKEATAIYYLPGYFRAKLLIDKKITREHDLFIPSQGWLATLDYEPVPTYLKEPELIRDGSLRVSSLVLEEIKKQTKPLSLTYHLVRRFQNAFSDNFTLETSFQNLYGEGPAICKTVKLFILCTKGAFIIPFTIPGCASAINLKLGNKQLDGSSNDLSAFATDPSQPMEVKVEVKKRKAQIFLNGKFIKEQLYEKDAGEIVGFRYVFLGSGSVNYLRLFNGQKAIVYREEFDN